MQRLKGSISQIIIELTRLVHIWIKYSRDWNLTAVQSKILEVMYRDVWFSIRDIGSGQCCGSPSGGGGGMMLTATAAAAEA